MVKRAAERPLPGVRASLIIVPLLCLWGAVESYDLEATNRQKSDPQSTRALFTRFEPVRAVVPENAQLGYLTDIQPPAGGTAVFLIAQNVLAPRLLEKGAAHDWVLGNFSRNQDFVALSRQHGLHLHQDFGDGLVLFRKER